MVALQAIDSIDRLARSTLGEEVIGSAEKVLEGAVGAADKAFEAAGMTLPFSTELQHLITTMCLRTPLACAAHCLQLV